MAKAKTVKPLPPYAPGEEFVANEDTQTSHRYPDVYYRYWAGSVEEVKKQKGKVYHLSCGEDILMELSFYRADMLRIRYGFRSLSDGFSYAIDPEFKTQKTKVKFSQDDHTLLWETEALTLSIDKKTSCFTISDLKTGDVQLAQAEPFLARTRVNTGLEHLRLTFKTAEKEAYFGLGDKTANLDLRGGYFYNWTTDSFGYDKDRDPLYRSIPFYYGLHDEGAYGIFLNNSYRTHFDFDSEKKGVTRCWADGGEMDFFYLHGPDLNDVAKSYHQLTGVPEMPPIWALGFHQCRWSYYPDSRVREVAATFRELNIPCDAIYLDIDYMDGYRCFTWNKEHFPKPAKLVKDLKKQGFQTVVMIDPGIKVDEDYFVYAEGAENDYFCRRSDGQPMLGPVWPPECAWPEYTRPEVRKWWGDLYKGLYKSDGIAGFWNDMNEPAVFQTHRATFPDAVQHDYDGHPTNHAKAHNIYGQQMARATYEGLKRLKKKKRPFLLARATFSGGQRHAAIWTGDNIASWEHLRLANIQCQRLSISGFSFCGTDIGGFVDRPSGELFVRWLQLGIFHPLYRVHSMGNNVDGAAEADAEMVKEAEALNRADQEPWSFGDPFTAEARAAIELRYQLLPYIYTTFRQLIEDQKPIIRSLAFADQSDLKARTREDEFLFGDHMLVSPVLRESQKSKQVYLPKGTWQNFWNGKILEGANLTRVSVTNYQIPIFARAGAIIPMHPVRQHTQEAEPDNLTLRIYVGGEAQSTFYWDAGEGYDYQDKGYRHSFWQTSQKKNSYLIQQKLKGNYKSNCKTYHLELFGADRAIAKLEVDGKKIDIETGPLSIPSNFKQCKITWAKA